MSRLRIVPLPELLADVREALEDLPRYRADHEYFGEHRAELLAAYDGQWVAVYQQKVVAHGQNHEQVIAALKEQGLRPSSTAIHFVIRKEPCFVLAAV